MKPSQRPALAVVLVCCTLYGTEHYTCVTKQHFCSFSNFQQHTHCSSMHMQLKQGLQPCCIKQTYKDVCACKPATLLVVQGF